MARGHFKHYGVDAKELRLQPNSKPKTIGESVAPQMQGIIKKIFDSMGEILSKHQMGRKVEIQNVSDFYKIASGMNALVKSQIEIERWEFEKTRRIEDVAEMFKTDLQRLLSARPELYSEMLPLMDEAAENISKEITAQEDEMPVVDIDIDKG